MSKEFTSDSRLTSRDEILAIDADNQSSKLSRKRFCSCSLSNCLKTMAYVAMSAALYIFMELVNSRLKWSPREKWNVQLNKGLLCVACDIVDASSGCWRSEVLGGRTICCLTDCDLSYSSQRPQQPQQQQQQQQQESPRRGIGAQLYINQTALTATPPRLAWSASSADMAYLDEGVLHLQHHFQNMEYDCLQVPDTQKYLINVQITFTNRIRKQKPTRRKRNIPQGHTEGPSSRKPAITSYYTVVRIRGSEIPVTLARIPLSLPPADQLPTKVPRLFFRVFHLQKGDKICITTGNLGLISADPYANYFGVLSL